MDLLFGDESRFAIRLDKAVQYVEKEHWFSYPSLIIEGHRVGGLQDTIVETFYLMLQAFWEKFEKSKTQREVEPCVLAMEANEAIEYMNAYTLDEPWLYEDFALSLGNPALDGSFIYVLPVGAKYKICFRAWKAEARWAELELAVVHEVFEQFYTETKSRGLIN